MAHPGRWMALVGRTPADIRDYCIDGPGGLSRNTPPHERPLHEVSKRRLTWPNGTYATIYSDEEPDQLRGFSGDTAWLDEFCKFKHARTTFDNLQFGMREQSADRPRRVITTTPRPLKLLREIEGFKSSVVVVMTSYENRLNLDPTWYAETIAPYEGTRLGRQEIMAEILSDFPGALWTQDNLDACQVNHVPEMERVVVAVDPSGTSGDSGDEIGIVIVGKGVDGFGYVLADWTCKLGPAGWGRRAVDAYNHFEADRIVAEKNYGGAMVEHTIRTVDANVPFTGLTASRGKVPRAEPVAALYEQGKVKHVSRFQKLEDQMLAFTTSGYAGDGSPDRADACVWGLTETMLKNFSLPVPMVW